MTVKHIRPNSPTLNSVVTEVIYRDYPTFLKRLYRLVPKLNEIDIYIHAIPLPIYKNSIGPCTFPEKNCLTIGFSVSENSLGVAASVTCPL